MNDVIQSMVSRSALASPQNQRANIVGLVGLSMVTVATVLSPTGFLGCTLFLLVPLGFGGLVVCAVSLKRKPLWPGIVGIVVGSLCVIVWIGFFAWSWLSVQRLSSPYGLQPAQFAHIGMSKMVLIDAAEAQRLPSGSPAIVVDLTKLDPGYRIDPWGLPYRYVLVNSPRGFTFMSDGPDGVSNTSDDIDLLSLDQGGMFEPPPPPKSSRSSK